MNESAAPMMFASLATPALVSRPADECAGRTFDAVRSTSVNFTRASMTWS
jgi:hypothetical protein